MKKKLTFKENMFIGSMLFGLFFGAGNLIFPIHLGQAAGSNVFIANLGFLITAIGLPFLVSLLLAFQRHLVYLKLHRVLIKHMLTFSRLPYI